MKLILVALIFLSQPAFGFDWFAFGDIRGHIEPCGCDPDTNLGGIVRIGSFFDKQRLQKNDSIVFDLGNNLLAEKDHVLKNRYIHQAILSFKPTASLVNYEELTVGKKALEAPLNWVLSNSMIDTATYRQIITQKDVSIFGYVSPQKGLDLNPFSSKLLNKWKRKLPKTAVTKVLLFSGTAKELKKIQSSKFFDLILSSNITPRKEIFADEEKRSEGRLLRVKEGKGIYMIPVGGQGILLGGKNQVEKRSITPTCRGNSGIEACNSNRSGGGPFANLNKIKSPTLFNQSDRKKIAHWLVVGSDESHRYKKLLTSFQREVEQASEKEARKLARESKVSNYAGDTACINCHQKETEVFKSSKHAKAFATLVEKEREKNPDCVSCHTVGYRTPGGFISQKHTPNLINVQCENCHGASIDHVKNPMNSNQTPKKDAKGSCAECHVKNHSPKFNFDSYWEQIKH